MAPRPWLHSSPAPCAEIGGCCADRPDVPPQPPVRLRDPADLPNNSYHDWHDTTQCANSPIKSAPPQTRRDKRKAKKARKAKTVSDSEEGDWEVIERTEVVTEGGRIEEAIVAKELSDEEVEDQDPPSISKNQAKKLRKQKEKEARKTAKALNPTNPTDSSHPEALERFSNSTTIFPSPSSIPRPLTSMPPPTPSPLFIASIGNPTAQYANTLHSAGHRIIQTLHSRLSRTTHMYPFAPERRLLNGLTSSPDHRVLDFHLIRGFSRVHRDEAGISPPFDWTLWQSPVLMDVSGRALSQAWKTWSAGKKGENGEPARLVVLHDELEAELGAVKVKKQDASARGHNGLKSIQASMPGVKYWRIGIGIGRPESREPNVVAKYVLRRMSYKEEVVLDRAADEVFLVLRDIYDGTKK